MKITAQLLVTAMDTGCLSSVLYIFCSSFYDEVICSVIFFVVWIVITAFVTLKKDRVVVFSKFALLAVNQSENQISKQQQISIY